MDRVKEFKDKIEKYVLDYLIEGECEACKRSKAKAFIDRSNEVYNVILDDMLNDLEKEHTSKSQ